jgi:hypothetical protein
MKEKSFGQNMDKRKAPLETGDRIEPALLEEAPTEITDIVAELSA